MKIGLTSVPVPRDKVERYILLGYLKELRAAGKATSDEDVMRYWATAVVKWHASEAGSNLVEHVLVEWDEEL